MSHLIFNAFKSVFDHCTVSLNQCSHFYDNIHITAGSGLYGMSRTLMPVCHNWKKLFLCSVTKLRHEILWYCNIQITLKM